MTDTSRLNQEAAAIVNVVTRKFALDSAKATVDLNVRLTALEKQVAALTPAPAPTPTPTPTPSGRTRGVGAFAWGGAGAYALSDLQRLDVVATDLGGDQSIASKVAPAVALCYGSALTVQARPESFDPATAQANGWLLKDASGNYLTNGQYGGRILDIWNPATGTALGKFYVNLCKQHGFAGISGDDVVAWATMLLSSLPAGRTQVEWHTALVQHVARIGAELKAAGLQYVPNASGFIPGDGNSDNGVNTYNFWAELAPYVTGLSAEYWQQNFTGDNRVRHAGSGWDQNWDGWRRLHQLCNQKNINFYAGPYLAPDSADCMYVRNSFYLDYRPGDVLTINPLGGSVFGAKWCADPGAPLGPATLSGGTWTRKFANETVSVTP